MKTMLGLVLVGVLVLGMTGLALAHGPGMGMGRHGGMMGQGAGCCAGEVGMGGWAGHGRGAGHGHGAGPCMQQGATPATAAAIDENKAKAIASEYVAKNLSGYKVEKLVKFDRPRGAMYQVEVKGPKGEVEYLHINPWGNVRTFGVGRTF
jgi:hypothetical protein